MKMTHSGGKDRLLPRLSNARTVPRVVYRPPKDSRLIISAQENAMNRVPTTRDFSAPPNIQTSQPPNIQTSHPTNQIHHRTPAARAAGLKPIPRKKSVIKPLKVNIILRSKTDGPQCRDTAELHTDAVKVIFKEAFFVYNLGVGTIIIAHP